MTNPFEGFQQGLMTGAQMGGRMRQNRMSEKVGAHMAAGDYGAASQTAYSFGELQVGSQLDQRVQQQAEQARNVDIAGRVQAGDFQGAQGVAAQAGDLAGMGEIQQWAATATEQQREEAAGKAAQMAGVIESIQSLPPEQQLAAAQQYAPQFGLDPAQITPQSLTPQALEGFRVQALGIKDYLTFRQRERDASRPIMTPFGIMLPPGAQAPQGLPGGAQSLGSTLPPGWTPAPRPNQASSAPARGGAERSQPTSVSFQSSQQARSAIAQIVPGVTFTSGRRSPADNQRVRGARGSFHLQDRAWDLVPPAGMNMGQLEQKMRQQGFRVLNEGDHIHVSW